MHDCMQLLVPNLSCALSCLTRVFEVTKACVQIAGGGGEAGVDFKHVAILAPAEIPALPTRPHRDLNMRG